MAWSETSKSNPIRRTTFVAFLYRYVDGPATRRGGIFAEFFEVSCQNSKSGKTIYLRVIAKRGEKTRNHFYIWLFSCKNESGSTFGKKNPLLSEWRSAGAAWLPALFIPYYVVCVHWIIRRDVHQPSHQVNSFCQGGSVLVQVKRMNCGLKSESDVISGHS